ncbi:MAG: glycosyltransferase [Planctomycetota bacterium]
MSPTALTQDLERLRDRHEPGWSVGYHVLHPLLRQAGLRRGAEVGVAFGGHSEAMLTALPELELIGVDAYRHRPDYDDPMNLPQPRFDALCELTRQRLAVFGERFRLIRDESSDAAACINDSSLDFVYLDADHSETGLLRDLAAWFPKVRDGGLIAGHDLDHPDFPGVRRAAERFFRRFNWVVEHAGQSIWTVTKRTRPVTFFTPAYNAERFISEAVGSVFQANFRDGDQYIVVDDASTDRTAAHLDALHGQLPDLQVIRHTQNRGGGAARNTAISHARHDLLFCLDADNVLLPGSLDRLRAAMDRDWAEAACFGEVRYFDESGEPSHTHRYPYGRYSLAEYLATSKVPGASGNYLFCKASHAAAGGYPEDYGALDTWGFGLRQVATGSELHVVPETGYRHRLEAGSYWNRYAKPGVADQQAYELLKPYLGQLHPADAARMRSPRRRVGWMKRLDDQPIRIKQADVSGRPIKPWLKARALAKRLLAPAA